MIDLIDQLHENLDADAASWQMFGSVPRLDDFDGIFDHLTAVQVRDASARVGEIVQAIQVLAVSPLIGRQ